LLPGLTALENVSLPLLADGVGEAVASKKSFEILEKLEMAPYAAFYPRQLSGGQQQRVAIGRALVHNPVFVVCDEPTAALDGHTGQIIMQLLSKIAKDAHRAVLVVTHDERIYTYGDRILTLDEGRVINEQQKILV
jgi:putative ABC transport system ATP-binding protein